eukprot:1161777-Pelagomonas_calceolata.AAC.4
MEYRNFNLVSVGSMFELLSFCGRISYSWPCALWPFLLQLAVYFLAVSATAGEYRFVAVSATAGKVQPAGT